MNANPKYIKRVGLTCNQISVEWAPGNQQWAVIGGGLPRGTCWSAHESLNEALREAEAIAEDMGLEVVS